MDAYKNGKKNILVMDARRSEDFQNSRLKYIESVNIPENIITSGWVICIVGVVQVFSSSDSSFCVIFINVKSVHAL